MREMAFGIQGKEEYGKPLNEIPTSVRPNEGDATSESKIRSSASNEASRSMGNYRVDVGTCAGMRYIDVAKERPDYCKEVKIIRKR